MIVQPLGTRSAYNTIIEDPGSLYVATFQCIIYFLFTSLVSTGLTHFISKKDQQKELLFYCPAVLDL